MSKQMIDKRDAIYNQGTILSNAGKANEAMALYSNAIQANPDIPGLRTRRAYLITGDPKLSLEAAKADALADIELGKKQKDDSKSLSAMYGALASYYQKKQQWADVVVASNEAIKLYPNNSGAYSLRAFAEHAMGNLPAMKADVAKMEQYSNPQNFFDSYTNAITFFNCEVFPKALVYENKAIALAPNDSLKRSLEFVRLSTLMQMKSLDAALAQVNALLVVEPKNAELLSTKGQALSGKGQDEAALACYTASLKQDSTKALTYKLRGDLYLKIIEEDRALEDYDQALKLDPTDWHSYAARARLYEQAKKYRLAIADATQSMKLGPKNPQRLGFLLELRGSSKLELHMYNEALPDLVQAGKIYPNSSRIKSLVEIAKKKGS